MKTCLCLIVILNFFFTDVLQAKRRKRSKRSRPWISYNIGGSYKSVLSYQSLRQNGLFDENEKYATEQRLRLTAELSSGPWRIELANQTSVISQNVNPPAAPLPEELPSQAWDTRQSVIDRDSFRFLNQIDRANIQYRRGAVEFIAGKQVVGSGVGKIFQSISQTPRQPFVIVNPEYPIPEDALVFRHRGSWATEARLFLKTPDDLRPSFHFVAKGIKAGYDIALSAGRSNDKAFVGIETAGNWGDSLIRSELIGYQTENAGSFAQGLIGLDRYFKTSSIRTELFYNGFGSSRFADFSPNRRHRPTPYNGKLYAGLYFDWDISPILTLSGTFIANLLDQSMLNHLSLTYSISRSFEVMLGQFFVVGNSDSEFGGQIPLGPTMSLGIPSMSYFLLKMYF